MENYKELKSCLCCAKDKLFPILDLGKQPLANSYHKPNEVLEEFPLCLNLCLDCGHTQLSVAVNPDLMFKNYLYVSGTTKTLRDYFAWFAKYASIKYGGTSKNVLDIACNDGSQLVEFAKLGYNAYGVDPAENLAEKAKANGVNLKVGYWDEDTAKSLPFMNIITAQNVFAHNSNPYEFLINCRHVMNKDSVLLIQTSQANMFANNEFDTIYHEHISFFCAKSMIELAKRCGFTVTSVLKPSIHGTSYIFELRLGFHPIDSSVHNLLIDEQRDIVYFDNWANKAKRVVIDLKDSIEKYKMDGYKIIGYGAAAKGNTLLNFGSIKLDYIVDDNNMKCGLMTPGMDIEIKSPEVLGQEENIVVIPLAWNFYDEIKKKVKNIRKDCQTKGIFILYFPSISVES